MARILGLDLGANSLGWALLDDETREVIDLGVRIFKEGYNDLGQGEREVTRNVERRMARLMRRQIMRRRRRKRKLLNWLKKNGLFPWHDSTDRELTTFNPYTLRHHALKRKLEPFELGVVFYHLNQRRGFLSNSKRGFDSTKSELYTGDADAIGLGETLKNFDPQTMTFGQYLDTLDKSERKRARYALREWYRNEFDRIWTAQQAYYPDLLTEENRKHVGDDIIFFQRRLKSQKDKVGRCEFEPNRRRAPASCHDAQFFRMAQQVNNLMIEYPGREPDFSLKKHEKETDKDYRRRIYAACLLTAQERKKLMDYLASHSELKIEDLGKVIGLPKEVLRSPDDRKKLGYKINLRGLKKLSGCRTRADIRTAVGDANFNRLNEAQLEDLWQLLHNHQYDTHPQKGDFFAQKIKRKFGWDEDIADRLAEIKLEDGYSSLSRRALQNLNPYLAEGLVYSDACQAFNEDHPDYPIKYHHSDRSQRQEEERPLLERLPKAPDLRNPLVNTCLTQLRHVVNAIMHHYGRPDKIRIELAREMNQNKAQREAAFRENKEREEINEQARKAIAKFKNIPELAVTKSDIIRYRLWQDQGKQCAYTGINLELARVFGGDVDVDHILPLSIYQDDSYMNKVLCLKHINLEKGQRTPYEAFGQDPERWKKIEALAANWPTPKKRRLLTQDPNEFAGFRASDLVATRYATRASLDYLRNVCKAVEPVTGQFTALLRKVLGLNSQKSSFDCKRTDLYENPFLNFDLHPSELEGNKSRLDQRHHAVDAVVIALSEKGLIQRANTFMSRRLDTSNGCAKAELKAKLAEQVLNWPDLVAQVKERLACVIVSYKKDPVEKVQGKMHKETLYGILRKSDGSPRKDGKSYLYVSREKLAVMKDSNSVEYIVDPVIREAARKHLRDRGVKVDELDKKGNYKYSFKAGLLEGLVHPGTGQLIRSARVYSPGERRFSIRKQHKVFKHYDDAYVQSDSIHHVAVFRGLDAKGRSVQRGYVMTLMEAYQRKANGQPVVDYNYHPEDDFLYTLNTNDLFLLLDDIEQEKQYRQLDWSNKKLYRYLKKEPEDKNKSIWERIYRVQYFDQTGLIGFRHHSMAKISILDASGKKRIDVGRYFKGVKTVIGLKLVIDPAGFLSIAEE